MFFKFIIEMTLNLKSLKKICKLSKKVYGSIVLIFAPKMSGMTLNLRTTIS